MSEEKYRLAMMYLDRIEAAMDNIAKAFGYASMDAYLEDNGLVETLPQAA
jgi:hypothetical protein